MAHFHLSNGARVERLNILGDTSEKGAKESATLMVNYPAAEEVAGLSAGNPNLGIGLHVALTGGKPVLPPTRVPSLVDATGAFPAKPEGLADGRADEILAEAAAS